MMMIRFLRALPAVALAGFGSNSAFQTISAEIRISSVQYAGVVAEEYATRALNLSTVKNPREWIVLASILSANGSEADEISIALLERALAVDPYHPDAWSLLAFLRTRSSNQFTDSAATALRESNRRCTLCNRAELKWRLTFTLRHWDQMPYDLRMSAFIGADFLRWWYSESEFLNKVRKSAKEMEIPFDEYRRMVGTPVRPNEIQ